MVSRVWIVWGITCFIMVIYLFWAMHIMNYKSQCPVSKYVTEIPMKNTSNGQINRHIKKIMKQNKTTVTPVTKRRLSVSPYLPTLVEGKDINLDILKFFTLRNSKRMDTFINRHDYRFTINSKKCSDSDILLIMLVHSAPLNYRKRRLIRTTYGSVNSHKGKKLALVFLLSAVKNGSVQNTVKKEAKRYGDIVQGNFPDSYNSLIRKHVMAMHWFKHHCDADFILKLDDDTFVNPFRTVEYILRTKPHGLTIHCKIISDSMPVRNNQSKWYTSKSEYPFPLFPPFCLGFAYITTPSTLADLYVASKTSRGMAMDDVYVSVVLAMKAHVHKIDLDNILYYCPRNVTLIHVENLHEKAIFVDRNSSCGEKPFLLWKEILNLKPIRRKLAVTYS